MRSEPFGTCTVRVGSLVVVPEFAGPLGVPDFTAYVGDIGRVRRRHNFDAPPIVTEWETGILSVAHVRRASSAQSVARSVGWPVETITDRLKALVKRGALIGVSSWAIPPTGVTGAGRTPILGCGEGG